MTARAKRLAAEVALGRKRDKEQQYYSTWNDKVQYYKTWERGNERFQNWTSPRYYETSNEFYDRITTQRKKEEMLEKRRDKLRKMLQDEERDYEYEIMVTPRSPKTRHKIDDIPTEVLKDVHLGIKALEEDKRRKEAELKLYHKWRSEHPVIREYERSAKNVGLKVAWLDHQIEKRMQKEKEDEETRALLTQRDKLIREEIERERMEKEISEKKLAQLKLQWDQQVKELEQKESEAKELKKKENEELDRRFALEMLMDEQKKEEERRKTREIALYNIKQYKLKMKQKALDVQENLENELKLIEKLMETERQSNERETKKKKEIRSALEEFLQFVKEQKNLEKKRETYVSAIFDSEAKVMWEKQQEIWDNEQKARDRLLKDVLDGLRDQIDEKISENLETQKVLLKQRQEVVKSIEESEIMFQKERKEEERRKLDRRKELDKQINDKRLEERKKQMEDRRKAEQEIDQIKQEEEKLKEEIKKIQERFAYVPITTRKFW